MKNITLKVISFISLFLLFTSLISSKPLCFTSNKNESIITIDSTSSVGLPMRLRDIPTLNISGSAQFTKDQLLNLKNSINKDNICIVDLRQESHGMINDLAISFLNPYKDLNNGFTTEQTIKAENSLLNKIKIGNTIQLYKHTGIFIKDITVDFISNESQLVTEADMQYKRFAVKDNSAPTPDIVDEFVEFIKNKPDDIHLHFHCAAGKGRTTFIVDSSNPIALISSSVNGIGSVPEPTNPVTPLVFLTMYQVSSVTIIFTNTYAGNTFLKFAFFLPSFISICSSIGTTISKK